MLTFEEKLTIINTFSELEQKDISMNRVNFHYPDSTLEKKIVVYHLHPNGNGFVFAKHIAGYETDDRGMVNIRNFTENELRGIIEQAIYSLSSLSPGADAEVIPEDERWINVNDQPLSLVYEEGLWNVYADALLDGSFRSYKQAASYLDEEGFKRE